MELHVSTFECETCGNKYTPQHPDYPKGYEYSRSIIQTALSLHFQDNVSGNRIATQLAKYFGVQIPPKTSYSWINALTEDFMKSEFKVEPKKALEAYKALRMDGTGFSLGNKLLGKKKMCNCHQIDGFHVMRELNNGIRRDFKYYRAKHYRDELNEFLELHSYLNGLQEMRKHADLLTVESIPPLKNIAPSHSGAKTCSDVIKQLLFLLTLRDPHSFFIDFDVELKKLLKEQGERVKELCDVLRSKFPKQKFTIKGRNHVQGELLKKLKTLCVSFRKPLKEEAREFNKKQFLLFKQPEKVIPKVEAIIEEFLEHHPTLWEYREMTLLIGEIYREPLVSLLLQLL